MEPLPSYFPMTSDKGTLENTPELPLRPKEIILYPYFTSYQSAPNMTWNRQCFEVLPFVCHLLFIKEFRLLSISFPFYWVAPFIKKKKTVFLHCNSQYLVFGSISTRWRNSFLSLTPILTFE